MFHTTIFIQELDESMALGMLRSLLLDKLDSSDPGFGAIRWWAARNHGNADGLAQQASGL
jgi:hypothetical protein